MAMPKARVLAPLNSGDVNSAQAKFDSVLAGNPNDGDALAGLGYIAQRKGDFASAAEYLTRAAQQGGPSGAQWSTQAEDSAFYARLAQAKDVAAGGNYASALAVVPPLTQQSGDKGQSAGLLRADDAVRPLVAKISAQRNACLGDVLIGKTSSYNMGAGLLAVRAFTLGETDAVRPVPAPNDDCYSSCLQLLAW